MSLAPATVPVPASLLLLGSALAGLSGVRRRQKTA
ncbi:VPLPA-CTERM sorting domain-containing protein [Tropicibacter sp. S64]